ncbi:DUF1097 domain-containing protein [Dongshaea marina]|uniref:DUF1097 domain-containing protein n=1 Tax=Dongshaea marina TaxID=2047966 RepID=UPI000D3E2494|nr:DUF1097 domain-containing protein [Dongshaea marina]
MTPLIAIAITTGILSGIWAWFSVAFGLVTWIGFIGCTSYFASQGCWRSLITTWLTNTTGVFWGMLLIKGADLWGQGVFSFMMVAIVAFMMCFQGKQRWLSYIPGTFAGCCIAFGSNGAWQIAIPSLLVGALFGFAMKQSGLLLFKIWPARFAKKGD